MSRMMRSTDRTDGKEEPTSSSLGYKLIGFIVILETTTAKLDYTIIL